MAVATRSPRTVPTADPFGVSMFDTDTITPGRTKTAQDEAAEKILIREAFREFGTRDALRDLTEAQAQEAVRAILAIAARHNWRIYKNGVYCLGCRNEIDAANEKARERLGTSTRHRAGRMQHEYFCEYEI